MGFQFYFKVCNTIRSLLVTPMNRNNITQKSRVIYRYKSDRLGCNEEYIKESAMTFGERLREHLRAPSPINDHANTTGHHTTVDNFSIVGWEAHNIKSTIKDAMYIRVNNPSLVGMLANSSCLTYGMRSHLKPLPLT